MSRIAWPDSIDQAAKPAAEYEHWPDPQRATGSKEARAEPPDCIVVQGPEPDSIRICRQVAINTVTDDRGRLLPGLTN
jgi:hypothetical protein